MFCSSCGSAVKPNLTFCNHCGAKLKTVKVPTIAKANEASAESLVWAIVAVFAVGMGTTIGLMAVMKNVLDFNEGVIIAFTAVSFLLMILVELVFVSMLIARRRQPREDDEQLDQFRAQVLAELHAAPIRVPGEPAGSVTEHSTKSFQNAE
ncbi:MAG: zinc ribbon domain-containing protein [Acidobacteriota bacterium]